MPKTYYDSELTGVQIENALEAIHGVVTPSNNGKVLCIVNGAISAKSASEWGHGAVLEPLSVTANGDYTPPAGTDGFDSVHVAVPSATLTTKSITQNGTYNASSDNADGYSSVTVNVSGGGSAVVQPLSVTENGTYNPPSGVDGYAPVAVNVSGGGSSDPVLPPEYQEVEYIESDGNQYTVPFVMAFLPTTLIAIRFARMSGTNEQAAFGAHADPGLSNGMIELGIAAGSSAAGVTAWVHCQIWQAYEAGTTGNPCSAIARATNTLTNHYVTLCKYRGYMLNGRLYCCKVYDLKDDALSGNPYELTFKAVPCYRKSDGIIGFYEVVSGTFLTNAGSGTFVKGPDIS